MSSDPITMSPNPPTPTSTGDQGPTLGPMNGDARIVRKRNRVPLSCAPCRNRKLKCNRSHPCENCEKRGDAVSCSYANPSDRRKNSARSSTGGSPDDMQGRIDRLENLVLTLVNNGNESSPSSMSVQRSLSLGTPGSTSASNSQDINTPSQPDDQFHDDEEVDSDTDKVANSFGVLHFNNNKATYLGEAHWGTVLNDITEIKAYFNEHKKQYEEAVRKVELSKSKSEMSFTGPAFVLGGRTPPKLSELLGSLPGRDAVDKLVQRYFSAFDSAHHVLHTPSWRRAYESHWKDPRSTTPVFLGQLYAMCGLAMQSYHRDGDEPPEFRGRTIAQANNYRMLTQQCMLLFESHKVEHAIVETYVLHLQSEYAKAADADTGVWILLGIVVRLAMRMGLHRDSQHFANISPFQGEMRRRLWTYIRLADIVFSFQVGLPNMIRSSDCDTELPLNLHDEDFDENSETLPAARPHNTLTSMSYMVAKASLAIILGRIVECVHSVRPPVYEDIMRLDRELVGTYHGLPSAMHPRSFDESVLDSPMMIVSRYHLSTLFNKSVCVLHRKFITRARESSRYAHSRRACIDAAMTILRHHLTLYQESQPGRRLEKLYFSAFAYLRHDFILAGTLVCLDLLQSAHLESADRSTGDTEMWGFDRREEMMQAIEQSRDLWGEQRDRFIEAYKAHEIIGVMLQKIQTIRGQNAARMARGAFAYAANGEASAAPVVDSPRRYGQFTDDGKPEHSAALTLGMLSSGGPGAKQGSYTGPYPPTPGSIGNPNQIPQASAPTPQSPGYAFNAPTNGNFNGQGAVPFLGPDMELSANFDWAALDSYISNSNFNAGEAWPQSMDVSAAPVDSNATSVPANLDPALPQYNNSNLFTSSPPAPLFPPNSSL